jgi:hypothetical protein
LQKLFKPVVYNDGFSEKWVNYLSPDEWRERVSLEFREVPCSSLEPAGSNLDPEVVQGWRRLIEEGVSVAPPVCVETERGTLYIHDGNHRFAAMEEYFGEGGECATVRVAIAVPGGGFAFRKVDYADYSTYELKRARVAAAQFVVPLLASGLALLSTMAVPRAENNPFLVLFVASVLISTWLVGAKAGLLATLFYIVLAPFYVLPPLHSFNVEDPDHVIYFVLTTFVMVMVAFFSKPARLGNAVRFSGLWLGAKSIRGSSQIQN